MSAHNRDDNRLRLLGSLAFAMCCCDRQSQLGEWFWKHPRTLSERRLYISAASVHWAIRKCAKLERSSDPDHVDFGRHWRSELDGTLRIFQIAERILPITEEHFRLAHWGLPDRLRYVDPRKPIETQYQDAPFTERLVIATAIHGIDAVPLQLIDFDQPEVEGQLFRYRLDMPPIGWDFTGPALGYIRL